MRRVCACAAMVAAIALSGCVVVPAHPVYYGPAYYRPAPVVVVPQPYYYGHYYYYGH